MLKLPSCPICDYQFSWRHSYKPLFKNGYKTVCPSCQSTLYATVGTRTRATLIGTMVPLLISFGLQIAGAPFGYVVSSLVIFLLLSMVGMPYLYRYKEYEEDLYKL